MIAVLDCEALYTDQLDELCTALQKEGMPLADLTSAQAEFFRFHQDGQTRGFAGIEGQGDDLLLRSMWTHPEHRSRGVGARMLGWIEALAVARDGERLHLLTTTAERFFTDHGFKHMDRAQAPTGIAQSQEFQKLCPANAIYLCKSLRGAE